MNLSKLFEIQKILDDRIVKEHNLHGADLLDMKILSLQVELGELANEWRGFKFWKVNPKPRTESKIKCHACQGRGYFTVSIWNLERESCGYCNGTGLQEDKNPLLEEYVDCLHFILSIGLEKVWTPVAVDLYSKADSITSQLNDLFNKVGDFFTFKTKGNYYIILRIFVGLGAMLGFTWAQIEQAYFDKNEINHARQENGY